MRHLIDRVDRLSRALSLLAAWAALAVMVGIFLLILSEVVLRSFFSTSTQIAEEYVGYGLGAMIFLGLGHALQSGALVRVDLVLGKLGPGLRRWVEVALCLVTLALMGFLMRFFWISVQRAYERGTISMTRAATPIWIPEGIMLAGMAIFTFALAVYCLRLVLGGPLIRDSGHIE